MKLNQDEILIILNWILEIRNRIISIDEMALIENLIKNHDKTRECIQVYEMKKEIKKLIDDKRKK